jgi:hypothetical protein
MRRVQGKLRYIAKKFLLGELDNMFDLLVVLMVYSNIRKPVHAT